MGKYEVYTNPVVDSHQYPVRGVQVVHCSCKIHVRTKIASWLYDWQADEIFAVYTLSTLNTYLRK